MLKQRICNDESRLDLLGVSSAFIKRGIEMGFTLSERLCLHLIMLAKTFPNDLNLQVTTDEFLHQKMVAQYELMRFLKFAVNDAKMGIIRRARRHGQPPEGQVDDLIPEMPDSINEKTNHWFEQARYLIANSQDLTNPTIVELKQRLADAELCSREVDTAKRYFQVALRKVAWSRTMVDAVIRQLNAELNFHHRQVDRQTQIAAMKLYGFKWANITCNCRNAGGVTRG